MNSEVLGAAARFIFTAAPEQQRDLTFLWHAGEPLAAGIPFYRNAFDVVERHRPSHVTVRHSIQTNGTLVNSDWCRFLRTHKVDVGISIDGPKQLHDESRMTWSGRGSFDRAMRGLALLREAGFDPAAICVLTPTSLRQPDEIYSFFRQQSFPSVAFNVEESEGVHLRSRLLDSSPSDTRAAYVRFMRRLWTLWRADAGALRIREFERELDMIHDLQSDSTFIATPDEVVPFANITIRRDGAISTFSPELASTKSVDFDDFVIGNVLDHTPAEVLAGPAFNKLQDSVARGRAACERECAYYALCGAGFQSNRYSEHGSLEATETATCRVHRQALTDVVMSELQKVSVNAGSSERVP